MGKFGKTLIASLLGTFAISATASAQTAVTTTELNLRAGPSNDFPVVTTIPDDAQVRVHGCLARYSWCDVSWDDERGWAFGAYLSYPYQGRYVVVSDYGDEMDLPIISYNVGSYWDSYYRSRPWYSSRSRWVASWRDDDRRSYRSRDRVERREFRGEGRMTEGRMDRDLRVGDRERIDRGDRDRSDRDRVRRSESREGRAAERSERFNRGDRQRQADRGVREQGRDVRGGGMQGRAEGRVRGRDEGQRGSIEGRRGGGGSAGVGGGAGDSGRGGNERGRDRR
jgi:uncharacterized protein YraI